MSTYGAIRSDLAMRSDELRLGQRFAGEFPVIEANGDVTASTAQKLRAALFQLIDAGTVTILVDLGRTRFIDSAGLGVLLQGQRRLAPGQTGIAIVRPSARIREILDVTRLSRVLPVFQTEDEAVEMFRNRGLLVSGR